MASYYVAKTGNDSNPGTFGSPKLTIAAAQLLTAYGDTIYIRKGVYTTQWTGPEILGRAYVAYQGEDVTIDMGGVFTGVNSTAMAFDNNTDFTTLVGLKFVNYTGKCFDNANSGFARTWVVRNCFFKPSTNVGTYAFYPDGGAGGCELYGNTFKGHATAIFRWYPISVINNIFDGNTLHFLTPASGTEAINTNLNIVDPTLKNYNAYPGATQENNGVNTTTFPVSWNNAGIGDYSLSPSSNLRGAGERGSNIGASFNPRIFVDTLDGQPLSAGVNDVLYYDPGIPGPGSEGPVDAGPAVFASGVWKIDNITVPGAKSARVKFGPYTLPASSVLRVPGWSNTQDLSGGAGFNAVVDNSAGTSTREIHISIDGGAKTLVSKSTNVNAPASTVTFYLTLRVDGQ